MVVPALRIRAIHGKGAHGDAAGQLKYPVLKMDGHQVGLGADRYMSL